jgi:hypothetical protein
VPHMARQTEGLALSAFGSATLLKCALVLWAVIYHLVSCLELRKERFRMGVPKHESIRVSKRARVVALSAARSPALC